MNDQLQMLEHVKQTGVDLALQFGPRALVALALLIAGSLVAHWAGRLADGGLRKFRLEPPVRHLLVRVVRIFLIGLFAIMALQNLGVELLPLIAGLGVAGAGIALAMQGVLGNLVAGLTVIFTKPFSVGEFISIAGEEGQVETISLFSTVLSHPDLSQVVIPNRKIVGEILHNYGRIRQLAVTVSMAQSADLDSVLGVLDGVLRAHPRVLPEPTPLIAISLTTPSAVDITLKPWVAVPDYGAVGSDIARTALAALRARNLAVAVPQREIRMLTAPAAGARTA
jgi:small conductance mechanosensitive channel